MSRLSWLQKIYWTRFAKPLEERQLFIQLISRPVHSILEIGIGDGQRLQRIGKLIRLSRGTESLRYIGTDAFESARDGGRHLSLKQAHQLASQLGFKATLIPGDISSVLPRAAYKFGPSDLVIINGGLTPTQPLVGPIGNWLNRLAHRDSILLACEQPGGTLELVDSRTLELPTRIAA